MKLPSLTQCKLVNITQIATLRELHGLPLVPGVQLPGGQGRQRHHDVAGDELGTSNAEGNTAYLRPAGCLICLICLIHVTIPSLQHDPNGSSLEAILSLLLLRLSPAVMGCHGKGQPGNHFHPICKNMHIQ